jgi:prepilin-type N-terminal cleavage/methylation domain-containing protein
VPSTPRRQSDAERGFTLLELLLVTAIAGTLTAIAIPQFQAGLDEMRTRAAARHLGQQLGRARTEAIKRSTFVGLRFVPAATDYAITVVQDGNGDGIKTADLQVGADRAISEPDVLGWHFRDVAFGILPGVPDADGRQADSTDGVRVGTSRILSMNPNGSSSSGTLYVHGRGRSQYAVRVLGATGRVRMLKYDVPRKRWIDQ